MAAFAAPGLLGPRPIDVIEVDLLWCSLLRDSLLDRPRRRPLLEKSKREKRRVRWRASDENRKTKETRAQTKSVKERSRDDSGRAFRRRRAIDSSTTTDSRSNTGAASLRLRRGPAATATATAACPCPCPYRRRDHRASANGRGSRRRPSATGRWAC